MKSLDEIEQEVCSNLKKRKCYGIKKVEEKFDELIQLERQQNKIFLSLWEDKLISNKTITELWGFNYGAKLFKLKKEIKEDLEENKDRYYQE